MLQFVPLHSDAILRSMASEISTVSIGCPTVCSGADQSKRQSSASLPFVRKIRRWPVDSPNKGPVRRKIFKLDDVIMRTWVNGRQIHLTYHTGIVLSQVTGHKVVCSTNYDRKIKLYVTGPLWGGSTSDRWIPLKNITQCGKSFHVITSLYFAHKSGTWQKNIKFE